MLPAVRPVTTRKGDRMAVLQLEDLSGSAEAWCSPRPMPASLTPYGGCAPMIWASVDRRDERLQLIVDDCRVIDDLDGLLVGADGRPGQ